MKILTISKTSSTRSSVVVVVDYLAMGDLGIGNMGSRPGQHRGPYKLEPPLLPRRLSYEGSQDS